MTSTRGIVEQPAIAAGIGLAVLIGLWWILAETLPVHAETITTPLGAVQSLWDNRSMLWEASRTTLGEAGLGFLAGNFIGILLAVAFVQSKVAERAVLQLAIVTHCLPIIAVGPLLLLLLNGTQPRVVMSGLLVFFPTVVTVQIGLRQTDGVALEIVTAYGGNKWHQLWLVRARTALPFIMNALRITAPLSLLGAILGEFLGGSGGIGTLIISAESANEIQLTWAIALLCTGLSVLSFIVFTLLTRVLAPLGSMGSASGSVLTATVSATGTLIWQQLRRVTENLAVGIVILIGVWQLLTMVLHVPALVFKSPAAVWTYMFSGAAASGNRGVVFDALGVTIKDALVGYAIGSVLALLVSCVFSLSKLVEGIVLPVAFLLQSVPILALVPLVTIEFGRGFASVAVITTAITFLPTLLTVTLGLRSHPASSLDLVQAYGGGRLFFLRTVAMPSAMPSMFAAMRLAAPTSLIGALLAEYLATGQGIGDILATSQTSYNYAEIWASVALIGIAGLLLYAVVSMLEIPILARFNATNFEV